MHTTVGARHSELPAANPWIILEANMDPNDVDLADQMTAVKVSAGDEDSILHTLTCSLTSEKVDS
jgi:hypothetical protein